MRLSTNFIGRKKIFHHKLDIFVLYMLYDILYQTIDYIGMARKTIEELKAKAEVILRVKKR